MPCRRTNLLLLVLCLLVLSVRGYAQQAAPAAPAKKEVPLPRFEILQPPALETVSGQIEIRVQVTVPPEAQRPTRIFAGIGKATWAEMKPSETADLWTAQFDTTLVPNGKQPLQIAPDVRDAKAGCEVMVANPLKVYFGDLHAHTNYSDGTLVPKVAFDYARHVAKLDVFCLTDHMRAVDDAEWLDIREQAFDANEDGQFVALSGLEWTKKWGHINLLDPQTRHWPDGPREFYQAIAQAGVTAKFNHPREGTVTHDQLAYSEQADAVVNLMEVRNNVEEKAYLRALKLGWHVAPDGSDDTHQPNWGTTRAWTGILAPGLTKQNILDALSHRHCYSTTDRNCRLQFTLNGAPMGDLLENPALKAEMQVQVEDPDAEDQITRVELFEDGEIVETNEPKAPTCTWATARTPQPGRHYYFVKITQADGNLLWSAPVWVTIADNN